MFEDTCQFGVMASLAAEWTKIIPVKQEKLIDVNDIIRQNVEDVNWALLDKSNCLIAKGPVFKMPPNAR